MNTLSAPDLELFSVLATALLLLVGTLLWRLLNRGGSGEEEKEDELSPFAQAMIQIERDYDDHHPLDDPHALGSDAVSQYRYGRNEDD